ncbi:MAG TPA: SRPBCC family protein [Burkholderiales bacterium]|nr:SRPBCC family protein [Burkholderiales bacterium]
MEVKSKVNLTKVDRIGYIAGGVALLGYAIGRPTTVRGGSAAGLGSWLLYQAYTGYNPMFSPLGIRVNQNPAEQDAKETIVLDEAITINANRDDLFLFWQDEQNLQRIAPRVQSIEKLDATRSRWTIAGPKGAPLVWESEITSQIPGREIAWRTTHKNALTHFGKVIFRDATGGRGSVIGVHLEYVSPGGALGTAIARMMGQSPQRLVVDTLRNLKQLIEVGEIATTVGQPAGGNRPQTEGADNVPGSRPVTQS